MKRIEKWFLLFALGIQAFVCGGAEPGSGEGKTVFNTEKNGCVLLNLRSFTNMGFEDETEGDEQGGWHDHGEYMDARRFPIFKESFSNIPFDIINPAANAKTSIVVFRNNRKKDGVSVLTLNISPAKEAKYLNLLHAAAWGQKKDTVTGIIEVFSDTGKKTKFPVVYGKDLADWFHWDGPKALPNLIPAAQIPAVGGIGYIYTSEFKLPDRFGKVSKVVIKSGDKDSIAYWMLIAATLSPNQQMKKVAEKATPKYVVTDSKEWKQFIFPIRNGIHKGSIFDFSSNLGENKKGRHILRKDGEYVFADQPDKPIRFMLKGGANMPFWQHPVRSSFYESSRKRGIAAVPEYIGHPYTEDSKKLIKMEIDSYADWGFNSIFVPEDAAEGLSFIEGKPGEMKLSGELIDLRNYMLKCAKDRGIKILWGEAAMDGYWRIPWTSKGDPSRPKHDLRVDDTMPERRARVVKAMGMQFGSTNPYTGTSIMKDPDVLSFLMRNECDKMRLSKREEGLFRVEMKKKYKTIEALKKAWKRPDAAWKSFDDLPNYSSSWQRDTTQMGVDYFLYLLNLSKENLAWFTQQCRNLGFQGPVTSYDMTKTFYNNLTREDAGSIYMHVYHGHPMGDEVIWGKADISQESPIANANSFIRNMAATQYVDKPFFMTEANIVYWNQYRYEQAFTCGAYAALNGFDGLLNFTGFQGGPAELDSNDVRIGSFFGKRDPICYATEFLNMHIFKNNAVKKSPVGVRLKFSKEDLIRDFGYRFAPNGVQTKLSLIFRFGLETPNHAIPMTDKDVAITRAAGSAVRNEKLFALIVEDKNDKSFNLNKFLAEMKAKGLLPKGNRTNPDKNIWESCTGELYMESDKKFGAIRTERVQGICGLAGTVYQALPDFKINKMTKNGTLNVVAVDGKPIRDSNRLAVVYATNALNRNIVFLDKSMRSRLEAGGPGVLYECGFFDVEINNKNASKLKAWPVSLDGSRGLEIPVLVKNGRAWFRVDVSRLPGGPAVFFELAEK